jgi:hypothetical protein
MALVEKSEVEAEPSTDHVTEANGNDLKRDYDEHFDDRQLNVASCSRLVNVSIGDGQR